MFPILLSKEISIRPETHLWHDFVMPGNKNGHLFPFSLQEQRFARYTSRAYDLASFDGNPHCHQTTTGVCWINRPSSDVSCSPLAVYDR